MTGSQFIVFTLLWVWQLPQNLCALVMRLVYGRKTVTTVWDDERKVWYKVVPEMYGGGLSLGNTVFVKNYFMDAKDTWAHEYGHCRQSRILGPLYLLVIGIPSLIWAAIHTESMGSYYKFYTERWADKLGGVTHKR